jgi:hypothetical protein
MRSGKVKGQKAERGKRERERERRRGDKRPEVQSGRRCVASETVRETEMSVATKSTEASVRSIGGESPLPISQEEPNESGM